jgi:DNA-binding CsgD family transcriptional regulator
MADPGAVTYLQLAEPREVARLVIDGLSTEDIAAALFISMHTVRDHLKMIFAKMGVSRRQDMVATLTGRTPTAAHTAP